MDAAHIHSRGNGVARMNRLTGRRTHGNGRTVTGAVRVNFRAHQLGNIHMHGERMRRILRKLFTRGVQILRTDAEHDRLSDVLTQRIAARKGAGSGPQRSACSRPHRVPVRRP